MKSPEQQFNNFNQEAVPNENKKEKQSSRSSYSSAEVSTWADVESEQWSDLVTPERELREFLDEILELDQSDSEHSNAETCYNMLLSRQDEFIGSSVEAKYWNAVSFELFHIAQSAAYNNIDQSRKFFSQSLDAAKKGISYEWLMYVQGTLYYLENNQAGLNQVIDEAGQNKDVLQRLLDGLSKRGEPNYKEDY